MEPEFWAARWREGRIGFHEGRANAFLERHVARLGEKKRVLVPLCGKTEDIAFLASRGHEVVGIELVEGAVRAFFREHDLEPSVTRGERCTAFNSGSVTLLAGDFFACTRADVGPVDRFYDRAALVALPAEMRARYVKHLRTLVSPGGEGIVVAFDYPQEKMEGPPFAVSDAEIRSLFAATVLDEAPTQSPKLRESGAHVIERCYYVT